MDRKLASIRVIADILSIEGADAIECVVVDGWKVVAKKNEFKVGDLCVYFEIDSVLPIREEFEFLRKGCYVRKDWLVSESNPTGEGFRLKTIRLRGQVSQGLVIPINYDLTEDIEIAEEKSPEDGMDLTAFMGVVKWDPPVPATLSGRVRGNFPTFIPKTDQERIQNVKKRTLDPYRDKTFEVTMKLDGSSMTIYTYEGKVGVCSRNLDLDIENDTDTTFARTFFEMDMESILKVISSGFCGVETTINLAIQGELMGPGIQGNRENLKDHQFFVFDVYDIDKGCYYKSEDRIMLVDAIRRIQATGGSKQIQHCPVIDPEFSISDITTDEFLAMAQGPSINHKIREGLVFKCNEDPSFSFKAISNQFLLKGGE